MPKNELILLVDKISPPEIKAGVDYFFITVKENKANIRKLIKYLGNKTEGIFGIGVYK